MLFSVAPREKLAHRTTSQKIFNDSSCMQAYRMPFINTAHGKVSEFLIVDVPADPESRLFCQKSVKTPRIFSFQKLRRLWLL